MKDFALGVLVVVILSATTLNAATYGGGSGTPAYPYQIRTPEQLNTIGLNSADRSKYFKLMNDIDMSAYTGTQYNIIGNSSAIFRGTIDGNNHIIRNLTYSTSAARDYVGLIGYGSWCTIRNLGLENMSISSNGSFVGGLIGNSSGTISQCYTTGTVSGNNNVGGLVGYQGIHTISNSYSTAAVSGASSVGGLAGYESAEASISNCYSACVVSGTSDVGPIVGKGGSSINTFWDTEVSGISLSATGKGRTTEQMMQSANFIGWNPVYTGWNWQWNFWSINEGHDYPRLTWQNLPGNPLPPQSLSDFVPGTGTETDPYRINTPEQMNVIGILWPVPIGSIYYRLENDIDMSGYSGTEFNVIGLYASPFSGNFDGNGHVIWNFSYNTTLAVDDAGLFGCLSGTIKNLGLENAAISSEGNRVGALVGCVRTNGTIKNCYTSGTVAGRNYVGGIAGRDAYITNCYSSVNVSGSCSDSNYLGGLTGSGGTIGNSYSIGSITAGSNIGGLSGQNSSIINSFWDMESSGVATSSGGRGRSTIEMKQADNYIGWNQPGQTNWTINEGIDYPRLAWQGLAGTPLPAQSLTTLLGGSGTVDDPYRVGTAEQLNTIGLFGDQWNKVFELTNDVNMAAYTDTQYNIIGNSGIKFIGTFDGNDHVIRNFNYSTTSPLNYVGLFGYADHAMIRNLDMENASIECAKGTYIGVLAGYQNYGAISNCSSTAIIKGKDIIGGMTGHSNYGTIIDCSTAIINGHNNLGGLAGSQYYGTVINCRSTGIISGSHDLGGLIGWENYDNIIDSRSDANITGESAIGGLVSTHSGGTIRNCCGTGVIRSTFPSNYSISIGGLAGVMFSGTIVKCHSDANVIGNGQQCGGLVGWLDNGNIIACYTTGSVTGGSCVGGLVGDQSGPGTLIEQCYSMGNVTGRENCQMIGGLVGAAFGGSISNSYSLSTVTAGKSTDGSVSLDIGGLIGNQWDSSVTNCFSAGKVQGNGAWYVGGFLGYFISTAISGCFWDIDASTLGGSEGGSGVVGKTTAQMRTHSTFTSSGWDFLGENQNGSDDIWRMCADGVDYPRLSWEFDGHGDFVCSDGVNFADFAAMANKWLTDSSGPNFDARYDMDGDSKVDSGDIAMFAFHWLEGQ